MAVCHFFRAKSQRDCFGFAAECLVLFGTQRKKFLAAMLDSMLGSPMGDEPTHTNALNYQKDCCKHTCLIIFANRKERNV